MSDEIGALNECRSNALARQYFITLEKLDQRLKLWRCE